MRLSYVVAVNSPKQSPLPLLAKPHRSTWSWQSPLKSRKKYYTTIYMAYCGFHLDHCGVLARARTHSRQGHNKGWSARAWKRMIVILHGKNPTERE